VNISPISPSLIQHSSKRRILPALLLAAFAVAALVGSALAASLVKNGSFEKDTNGDGIPNKWTGNFNLTPADKRVCNQSYAGACSFKMVGDGSSKSLSQELDIQGLASEEFILSAWTKRKDIVYATGGYAGVFVRFNHTDGSNNAWAIITTDATSPWTLGQVSATAFENFDSITIILDYYIADSGKWWVDKVKLVAAP
jgi:hypothetical protein